MTEPLQILADHVAETLPDSLSRRKTVLSALDRILKPGHPAKANVTAQISVLETLEKFQAELPLKLKQ